MRGLIVSIRVNGEPVDATDFAGDIYVRQNGEEIMVTVTITADSAELGPDGSATVTVSAGAEGATGADDE